MGTSSSSSTLNPDAFFFCEAAVDGTDPPTPGQGWGGPVPPNADPGPRPPPLVTRFLLCPANYLCVRRSLIESRYLISLRFNFISNISLWLPVSPYRVFPALQDRLFANPRPDSTPHK